MNDRLLKESDVIEVVTQYISCDYPTEEMAREDAEVLIGRTPTADRPQGEWIFKPTFPNDKSEFPMGSLVCSVCGSHHSNSTPCNYCDNCGARMKGADDE